MRQSAFKYLGLLVIIVPVAMVAMFGIPASTVNIVIYGMLLIAGVLFIVASTISEVTIDGVTLRWRQGIAVGTVLVAVAVPVPYVLDIMRGETSLLHVGTVIIVIGASVALLFFAFDIVGGGRYFKLRCDVDRRIGGHDRL